MRAPVQANAGYRAGVKHRLLFSIVIAACLGGCQHTEPVAQEEPYPFDYRQRHPITLVEGDHTIEIFVARNRGGLTPDQRADVLSFAQAWNREGESGIVINVPRGPTVRATPESLREIESILIAAGVPRRALYTRRYPLPPSALASIKLSYSKLTATAGPCGQWPTNIGPSLDAKDFENRPYWNLGCATQRNLASMVANPEDLVQPRGETPVYAARRTIAIDKYHKGDSPSATYNGYDSGKISDLGK